MPSQPAPLTPKEKQVLEFIEAYFLEKEYSPTYTEIKEHFGFASYNSVQRYLAQLQKKNYIDFPGGNQKRALALLHPSHALLANYKQKLDSPATSPHPAFLKKVNSAPAATSAESLSLPLLGKVAAGQPIEALEHDTFVDTPASLIPQPQKTYALTVSGQSMIEDGIYDGDTIFVQQQSYANNGEIVVALIDNEATVKRIYFHKEKDSVELRPSNATMSPMWYPSEQVRVEGVVVGLIRQF